MRTLELFSGTGSFSKVAKKLGHDIYRIELNKEHKAEQYWDLSDKTAQEIILSDIKDYNAYDFVWMSPPCTTFSMAAGNTHWNADRTPKTENAKLGKKLLDFCREVAELCEQKGIYYCIENPRARARWFMPNDETRKTVWYCQYGDNRAKPTDIWTNIKGFIPKTCHNGNRECHHQPAPRGSRTGTQGLRGNKERSVIPPKLFYDLFEAIENELGLLQ